MTLLLRRTFFLAAASSAVLGLLPLADANGALPAFVTDRLLVKPRPGTTEVQLHAALAAQGAREFDNIPALDVRVVQVPAQALDRVLIALQHNPHIEFVEKDFIAQAVATADDPYFTGGYQWYLPKIYAPSAWDMTVGASNVAIAVLDTGANYAHPDLAGKLMAGYDFVNSDSDASDDNGHGTGVSGVAAAASNNGTGMASVAWANPVMPLKVLDASGSGSYSTISKAINYAADSGARVINMSFGASSKSTTLQNAVNYAWSKGAVLVAAAGNSGTDTAFYPAACKNVVAVSATNSNDLRTSWSNYGTYVDIAAPGESILTTWGSSYGYVSGTSFSSPITAGVVGLMFAAQPALANTEVVDLMLKNADDIGASGYDVYYGHGRVNAYRAVTAASNTGTIDTTLPVAAITSPSDGSSVSGTVGVNASASDNLGITKMEILLDGVLAARGTSDSISVSWNTLNSADGTHVIEARAYDAANNMGSSTISVVVSNLGSADTTAPVATISSPKEGATVTGITKVYIAATDAVGVTKVELYVDGKFFGSSTSSSAVFNWNTRKETKGSHKLQSFGYDAAGNIGASPVVTVNVK